MPRNIRNEGKICPSQASNDVARNQKAWRATTRKQKAGTSENPKKKKPKGEVVGKIFDLAGMDSAHLRKITKRKDSQKLSLKGKKP